MVTALMDASGGNSHRLILGRSEAPVSPAVAMMVFLLVAGSILTGAGTLWILGIWQVMPMSVLVLAAVGVGLLNGYHKTLVSDVIAIIGDRVAIEKHSYRDDQRYEFQRAWAQVVFEEPVLARPDLSHLYIRSHGQKVEIGAFLDGYERRDLAAQLKPLIGPLRSFDA